MRQIHPMGAFITGAKGNVSSKKIRKDKVSVNACSQQSILHYNCQNHHEMTDISIHRNQTVDFKAVKRLFIYFLIVFYILSIARYCSSNSPSWKLNSLVGMRSSGYHPRCPRTRKLSDFLSKGFPTTL